MDMPGKIAPSRLVVVAVFAMFFVPFLAAWFLAYHDWAPSSTTNYGTLIEPVRSVTGHGLVGTDEGTFSDDFFHGKWTLVFVGQPPCDENCQSALYTIRQVRLALGKDMGRVQRLYVVSESNEDKDDTFFASHPGLEVASANRGWLRTFSLSAEEAAPQQRIFVVDPRGYLMMHYAATAEPKGILKDLKRLLKASRVG